MQGANAPVRIEGARGALGQAQAAKILEDLRKRSPDTSILDRHLAVEQALAGNPLSVGNKVVLLEDGKQTYPAMLAAIRGAKHHVHMETYIFDADEVGNLFAAALIERAKAGVKVRLIVDSIGSNKTPREFFQRLADGGVDVRRFNPVTPVGFLALNHRDHRKLTLVDGCVAFLGGINISGVYAKLGAGGLSSGASSRGSRESAQAPFDEQPWRDTEVRIEGPVVADLQRGFLKQWARVSDEKGVDGKAYFPELKPAGNHVVRAIDASPSETAINPLYAALVSAIDSADTEVHITNAYFVPHPDLLRALQEAARRGVEVTLILPSRTDSWLAFNAGRSYYEDLLVTGVKIYERKGRLLHAKSATIDRVWATVGSTNLDWRSLVYNDELNAVVLGPEFAAQANALFARDLAESEQITREQWAHRPLQDRLRETSARTWALML